MKTNRTMTAKERVNSAYGLTAQNPVKPKIIVWYVLQQAIDEVGHQFVYCDTDSVYYLDDGAEHVYPRRVGGAGLYRKKIAECVLTNRASSVILIIRREP